jgi:hypothetical protein
LSRKIGQGLRSCCTSCTGFLGRWKYWLIAAIFILFVFLVFIIWKTRSAFKRVKVGFASNVQEYKTKARKLKKKIRRQAGVLSTVGSFQFEQQSTIKSYVETLDSGQMKEFEDWCNRHGLTQKVEQIVGTSQVLPIVTTITFVVSSPSTVLHETNEGCVEVEKQGLVATFCSYAFDPTNVNKISPDHGIVRIWKSLKPGSIGEEIRNPDDLRSWAARNAASTDQK